MDECVRVWKGRVGSANFESRLRVLLGFFEKGLPESLRGFSPSELVDFQVDSRGRERFLILRAAQSYVNGLDHLRVGSKQLYFGYVRSFFLHNLAELPRDLSFSFTSVKVPVVGCLEFDFLRRILLNCNKLYKAVFLMMAQGIMGEGELVFVSNNHAEHVLQGLSKGGLIKLSLPGRKKTRNRQGFYSVLSTKSDWAEAMRDYLKSLPRLPTKTLFVNGDGNPLTRHNIQYYFHWRAVEAGVIKQHTPDCELCGGETLRTRKNGVGPIVYVCQECNHKMRASRVAQSNTLGHVRYGVNPHEIRDLMRSRWQVSGADPLCAEFIMGHEIDGNNYNRFYQYEPQYVFNEYRKALPFLNVLSCDPNKVDKSQVQEELEGYRRELEVLRGEVAKNAEIMDLFSDPEILALLKQLKNDKKS